MPKKHIAISRVQIPPLKSQKNLFHVTFFKQTVSCARKALQADVCGEAVGNDAAATDFERRLETKPHGGETTVRFN